MNEDDIESDAMARVIESMGDAAKAAKVKKYTPKPKAVEMECAPEEPSGESNVPSMEELAALLGN